MTRPAAQATESTQASPAAHAVDLCKTYGTGQAAVHAVGFSGHHLGIAAHRQTGLQSADETDDHEDEQHNQCQPGQRQGTARRASEQVADAVLPRQQAELSERLELVAPEPQGLVPASLLPERAWEQQEAELRRAWLQVRSRAEPQRRVLEQQVQAPEPPSFCGLQPAHLPASISWRDRF